MAALDEVFGGKLKRLQTANYEQNSEFWKTIIEKRMEEDHVTKEVSYGLGLTAVLPMPATLEKPKAVASKADL